jgi:deoxyribonuclease-4
MVGINFKTDCNIWFSNNIATLLSVVKRKFWIEFFIIQNMIHIGAHVSIAGGFSKSVERAVDIGANCMQVFSSSPRGWNIPYVPPQEIALFQKRRTEQGIDPVYFHAAYLINLADDGETGKRSKENLIAEMTLQPRLGIKGSVVHLGSYKKKKNPLPSGELFTQETQETNAYDILIENIYEVLRHTPRESFLLIENSGTRKIGQTLEEIADIIKSLQSDRIKVCLDTCHLHVAGYDLTTEDGFKSFFEQFDSLIGLSRLELIHINDSKDEFGSLRDRHENIGQGYIGTSVFKQLVNDPITKNLPLILETPGFDKKGPDKQNVDIITSFRAHQTS